MDPKEPGLSVAAWETGCDRFLGWLSAEMVVVKILKCGMSSLYSPANACGATTVKSAALGIARAQVQDVSLRGSFTGDYIMNVSLPGTRFMLPGGHFARFHFKVKDGTSRMEVYTWGV